MATLPSTGVQEHQDRMVKRLVDKGYWNRMDALYIFAQESNGAGEALLNWRNPGTYNGTAINSPAFTSLQGFTGDGSTSYINTNFNPAVDGVNFAQNSASFGVYVRKLNNRSIAGYIGAASSTEILSVNNSIYWRLNSGNEGGIRQVGALIGNRTSPTNVNGYINGSVTYSTTSINSSAVPSRNVWILTSNGNNYPSDDEISLAFIGGGFSPSETSELDAIFRMYMDEIGKGALPVKLMSGEVQGVSATQGALTGEEAEEIVDISGGAATNSAVTGTLIASGTVTGTVESASLVSGLLNASGILHGAITSNSVCAGSLTFIAENALSGNVMLLSQVSGTLQATGSLVGLSGSLSITTGELTSLGSNVLVGTSHGASLVSATIRASATMQGSSTSNSVTSGNLTGGGFVTGSISSGTTLSASGLLLGLRSGVAAGLTSVQGELEGYANITAQVATGSIVSGWVASDIFISGSLACSSFLTGNLIDSANLFYETLSFDSRIDLQLNENSPITLILSKQSLI